MGIVSVPFRGLLILYDEKKINDFLLYSFRPLPGFANSLWQVIGGSLPPV